MKYIALLHSVNMNMFFEKFIPTMVKMMDKRVDSFQMCGTLYMLTAYSYLQPG
jgi:hypothetical protein